MSKEMMAKEMVGQEWVGERARGGLLAWTLTA